MSVNNKALEFTGERMVPEKADAQTFWAHIYRYRFALPFVKNKRVLDIACGEGYGTSSLRLAGAKKIIGIDLSYDACKHAQKKYGEQILVGSAEEIPLANNSVNVIVSFETIEHLYRPFEFMKEVKRVLTRKGILIMSSPNKEIYDIDCNNEFHLNEFTKNEFIDIIRKFNFNIRLFGQVPIVESFFHHKSICARTIPTSGLPGLWRANKIRKQLIQDIYEEPMEKRENANLAILEKDNLYSKLLNPYIVRPIKNEKENFLYYVAVAHQ